MALSTVYDCVSQLYRYLTKEQRVIPHVSSDWQDPLPDALAAINGALQEMAVLSPLFAAKQQRSAFFRAPATVSVTGLSRGGKTCAATWPTGAAGCLVRLPGDAESNRILSISGSTATLQFPHLSDAASGTATVVYDAAALDPDVVTVLEPVRLRGGAPIRPANGRWQLSLPAALDAADYGSAPRLVATGGEQAYFIESAITPGAGQPVLRMMLRNAPASDLVIEYQARCSLGRFGEEHVVDGAGEPVAQAIPVPAAHVESVFYPLALMRFFAAPVLRNTDAPDHVVQQARTAQELLKAMRPQGRKEGRIYPGL